MDALKLFRPRHRLPALPSGYGERRGFQQRSHGLLRKAQSSPLGRQRLGPELESAPAACGARAQVSVAEARSSSELAFHAVVARGRSATRAANQAVEDRLQLVAERAQGSLESARDQTEALMREVTGQGPEKTLARGFAIVRTPEGKPVTGQAQARALPALETRSMRGNPSG